MEGAQLRVEAWPQEVDAAGNLVGPVSCCCRLPHLSLAPSLPAAPYCLFLLLPSACCFRLSAAFACLLPSPVHSCLWRTLAHSRIAALPAHLVASLPLLPPLQVGAPPPPDFPVTLTRKDAHAFVKAAKQRGVVGKLDLIAKGGCDVMGGWCGLWIVG